MTPRTDVCNICEKHRERIQLSVSEEEKLAATGRFQAHLTQAAQEREHYTSVCEEAASSLSRAIDAETVPSTNHHTFDFSQQVFLPYNARQVGPLYFKVPLRVCLFGVCDDGVCQQTNFTFSEAECIGLDGGKSHGGNAVVSMLHSYLENKTHGEAGREVSCRQLLWHQPPAAKDKRRSHSSASCRRWSGEGRTTGFRLFGKTGGTAPGLSLGFWRGRLQARLFLSKPCPGCIVGRQEVLAANNSAG